ncbi:AAA-like domain-containing protein [Synechocystis sp. LKSZ1]|uniref:AAA-like domain-containing protein n=1 Tax=Synechocystis sp. LKSZ1 TaxID=3144951 RepID=UPI00336BEB04
MLEASQRLLYKVGGSLAHNHPTYVERAADQELLQALLNGRFCYVFNCRQMGKSSLRVRTMHNLQQQGFVCVSIDITSLGNEADPHKWYNGLITQLFLGLALAGKLNLKAWLKERDHLSPVQKVGEFLDTVVLPQFTQTRVFIFIDEIDKVLSLPFSLDDFFSFIRFCYNQRAEHPEYDRLCFALFGVATPSDLIQDKTQTPFNIGQAVALNGFSPAEIQPLAQGLAPLAANPSQVLQAILAWTGGQPFLTQKICSLLLTQESTIPVGQEIERVEQVIQSQILEHWESQDEPVHLRTIRDRLLRTPAHSGKLLGLYQEILRQGSITADDSPEQTELRLTGLVVKVNSHLQVYNRIYQSVFNPAWVSQELAKLRPYSESFLAWVATDGQDTSRLLRGQALQAALAWANHHSLSPLDYQYLNASQTLERQESERANQILQAANRKAQRMIWIGLAILVTSLLGSVFALRQAQIASAKQQTAQAGTKLQRLGDSANRQFDFEQIHGLVSALQAGQSLYALVKPQDQLPDYPATSPLLALQRILSRIQEKNQLQGHQEGVTSVSFRPDGQVLASASRDYSIRLWNLRGQLLRSLPGHQGAVYRVAFSPDGQRLASASQDGTVKLWTAQGQLLKTLRGHQGSVYGVRFSPDGQYLVSVGRDRTARLWRRNGELVRVFQGHGKSVDDVQFSPDGQSFITVCRDGHIRRWSLQGQLLRQFGLKDLAFFSLDISPDGQTIVAAAEDGTLRLWSLDGRLLATWRGHQELVTQVQFSADGQRLFSASSDGTVLVWDRQGNILNTLRGHTESVSGLALAPQGSWLATASEDATIKLWNLEHAPELTKPFLPGRLTGVALYPGGNQLALAWDSQPLQILDLQGHLLQTFPPETAGLSHLTLSQDGQWLVGNAGGGTLQVWDRQGRLLKTLQADMGRIYDLSLSADQRYLAVATRAGKVWLWDLQQAQATPWKVLAVSSDRLRSLAFNPRTGKLLVASDNGQLSLWNLDGRLVKRWQGHRELIYEVRWQADGQSFLTASRDGDAKRWSSNGQLLQTLHSDPLPIQHLGLSNDGQWIATASSDGMVRLWDRQGQLRGEWQGQGLGLQGLTFSSDSRFLLSVGPTGHLTRWPVTLEYERLGNLLRQGCQWLGNYLETHPQQRQQLPQC